MNNVGRMLLTATFFFCYDHCCDIKITISFSFFVLPLDFYVVAELLKFLFAEFVVNIVENL